MNIYIETYGCSANQNNSEIMAGLLSRAGHIIVSNDKIAHIFIINTCIVKGPTLQKMLSRIALFKDKKLVVSGCMSDIMVAEILKIAPKAALVGSQHINDIVSVVSSFSEGNISRIIGKSTEEHLCRPKVYKNSLIGINQISQGCLGNCAYCIVKLAKGHLYSYPEEKILKSIKLDLESGCKEIWITAQDCAAYGLDSSPQKTNLALLLKKIAALKGKFLLRIGMSNPNHILPILSDLAEIYKSRKIFKFIHIPLQSGSNKILLEMSRHYKKEDFIKIVEELRKEMPSITIATDIIAGYPGETEEDFNETLEVLKQTRPDIINISRYWPMPSTKSYFLKQLKPEIVMKRTDRLMKLHNQIALEKNNALVGNTFSVFVDEKSFDDKFIARTPDYRPVIVQSTERILGKNVSVKITKATNHYLIGEILKN